jgi:ABC-2 type transport system ATP-binding protein
VRGRVQRAGRAVPGLLRELEASAITLEAIEVHRPTLDDVFLTLTGRSLRDAESGPGGDAADTPDADHPEAGTPDNDAGPAATPPSAVTPTLTGADR